MKRTKLNRRQAVNLIAIIALLFLTQNLIQAQIITRVLEDGEKIEKYIPWYFLEKPDTTKAPAIDVLGVLAQDSIEGRVHPRLGIKQELNSSTSDGTFYEFGNYQVWKLMVYSYEAKTISFKLTDAFLPDGSEMFIYNPDTKFVVGPIYSHDFHESVFNSDVLKGDYSIIEVFLPENAHESFALTVKDITHGIINFKSYDDDFGDSGDCNINVACPAGAGFENEIAAVCKIIHSSIGSCTGALINNECNDFTPFILTANHCVPNAGNLPDYVFRFNYESPTCPTDPNGFEPHPNLWITFSGAVRRASSATSDFALLELNAPVIGNDVAFAGWNRANTTPPNTSCIHHPKGDVKKISFDVNPPTINGAFHDVVWDTGTTEPGSSGSPLFDNNQLIIGQLCCGDASCSNPTGTDQFGRVFDSWTGDGTNATRLSNWLGGVNNPMTVNTSLIPFISGDNVLCTSNKTYTLQNPVPGYAVSWDVSPTSLFGSPTSGNGTTANLWAANSASQGSATLTYTLTNADCGTQTFTKSIWIGKPSLTGIRGPECFTPGTNVSLKAQAQGATNFTWSFPTCPNGTPSGDPDPDCWFNYTGNFQQIFVYVGQQGGSISVWASNECGTSPINVPIEFCEGGEPGPGPIIRSASNDGSDNNSKETEKILSSRIVAYPNPVNGILTIELSPDFYTQGDQKNIHLLDISGKVLYQNTVIGNTLQINAGDFSSGIYYLKVRYRDGFSYHKIIIL